MKPDKSVELQDAVANAALPGRAETVDGDSCLETIAATRDELTTDRIRARAYDIYRARNGSPGDPDSDWRQAEHELLRERDWERQLPGSVPTATRRGGI